MRFSWRRYPGVSRLIEVELACPRVHPPGQQLLVVSEAYPELHASGSFLELQRDLVTTEDRIQAARRLFNSNVREYNQRVDAIPSNVVAKLGGFPRRVYFEIEPSAAAVPSLRSTD